MKMKSIVALLCYLGGAMCHGGTMEISARIVSGGEHLFVLRDTRSKEKSGWLKLGEPWHGHMIRRLAPGSQEVEIVPEAEGYRERLITVVSRDPAGRCGAHETPAASQRGGGDRRHAGAQSASLHGQASICSCPCPRGVVVHEVHNVRRQAGRSSVVGHSLKDHRADHLHGRRPGGDVTAEEGETGTVKLQRAGERLIGRRDGNAGRIAAAIAPTQPARTVSMPLRYRF